MKTGDIYKIEHDGFVGSVIGEYTTREGREGVVLQMLHTKVVHVYGKKWLEGQKPQGNVSDLTTLSEVSDD